MIIAPTLWSKLAVAAGVFIIGFGFGFTLQGWRLNSAHADSIKKCTDRAHELELSIERQNGGINLAAYKLEVAEDARKAAQANADFIKNQYAVQSKRADAIIATTCSAMVEQLKGIKQ